MISNEVRERSFLQSFLDVLVQSILLAFLFVSPWFYGLTPFRDQLLAQIFVFSFFLVSAPFRRRKTGFEISKNPFDAWVFLGLVTGFFYFLFSTLPYQSLLAFLRLLGCVVFYGLIRTAVRTDKALRVFLWAILVLGLFYSSYGLLQYYGFLSKSFWSEPFSLASRYVNAGHFATLLLFPLFIGMALLASSQGRISQGFLITFLLIIAWALLLTRTRSVWIAFLAGLVVFVSLGTKSRFFGRRTISGILVLAGIGGFLLLSQGGLELIRRRFEWLWITRFYSLIHRWHFWEGALAAISERPWGWGLGTLSEILPKYRVQADRFFIDYAHNEFLQVGVDLGIPGMLFLAGFVFFYLRKAWSFLKKEEVTHSQKAIVAGFLALWVSLVIVCQVDFPLRIYATGILFATFLGLSACLFEPLEGAVRAGGVVPWKKGRRPPPRFFENNFWIIPWVIILISNFIAAKQLFAELHFNEGKRLEENFSWGEAEREYERAVRLSPFYGLYREVLGLFYERRAGIALNPKERKMLQEKVIQNYQEAVRLHPYRGRPHYFLALRYEKKGDSLRAQSEFLKAIALEPRNWFFLSEYGHFALKHSSVEEAMGVFEKLKDLPFPGEMKEDLDRLPRLFYRSTQDYDQLRRLVRDNLKSHDDFARLLVENGRWDLARKEFEAAKEKGREIYLDEKQYFESVERPMADFYLSHGRAQEALEIYQEAAARRPEDGEVRKKVEELSQKIQPASPLGFPP